MRVYVQTTIADPRDVLGLGVRVKLPAPRYVAVLAKFRSPKKSDPGSANCAVCGRVWFVGPGCTGVYCGCEGWTPQPPLNRTVRVGPRNALCEVVLAAPRPSALKVGETYRPDEEGRLWTMTGQRYVRPFRGLTRA